MDELNELLEKASSLNSKEKYKAVIDLLDSEKLELYNNSKLYSEKAQAYYRLKEFEQSEKMAFKSISINSNDLKGNHYVGNYYLDRKKFNEAIEKFKKIIDIDANYFYAYHGFCIALVEQKDYEKAREVYSKGLVANPNQALLLYGLGNLYSLQKNHQKSLEFLLKALENEPKNSNFCNAIGIQYKDVKDNENAIKYYSKAIDLNKDNNAPIYNRAMVYFDNEEYKKSKLDYEKYVNMTRGINDFYSKTARARIVEIKKIIKSSEYNEISNLVNKIKSLLLFKDGCVTHYSGLTVARALILDNSLFRLSEGAFLNDTSEGRELFKFLSFQVTSQNGNETIAEKFSQKPFIGSFVAETKHDDLTLWRMYGKEQKEEAKGCALTLDMNKLLENLNEELVHYDDDVSVNTKLKEEFNFYRVAYRRQGITDKFFVPNFSISEQKKFNEYMGELQNKIKIFKSKKRKKVEDVQNLLELLNEIAYLFKSDEYRFENEVRLVIKGLALDKKIDYNFQPPKVYVELLTIRPLIRKITLGPKVERADEWAAAFFYNLDKDNYYPEILISHLPFK